jgi:hypothetical protein
MRFHLRMGNVVNGFEVRACLEAIAAVEADLNHLVSALTEAQFHAPPRNGDWSVGYCIEHLVLTGLASMSKWDMALMNPVPTDRRDCGFSYRWWHRKVLRLAEPPYRLKTKTSPALSPCSRRSREETLKRFLNMHQEFARRVAGIRGVDLEHTRVRPPFALKIGCPLGLSFDLFLAHERRHLWQAWQVRREIVEQAC